jgi:lambda family phage portal protein
MKKAKKRKTSAKPKSGSNGASEREFSTIAGRGSANQDWNPQLIGDDADLWQSAYMLTSRMRDLFKTNPIYVKYRELLWANIFGENGIMLRMKIKETEDRVVNSTDEKNALIAYEHRINRIRAWANEHSDNGQSGSDYRAYKLADAMERSKPEDILEHKAKIQVGDADVFANLLIERAWARWQRAEFCDVRSRRNYHTLRQLRLINGVRDGDFFLRHIRDPKVNEFGYSLQMVSSEWCDRFYRDILPNGNVVVMGIEYEMNSWGLGKPVAFYFIKRQPRDWQFTSVYSGFGLGSSARSVNRARIDAADIIHYARPVDADATRPAPWAASTMVKGRQLDQYELAEVIASREAACKTGFYYSDILPEGGQAQFDQPDPTTGMSTESLSPGEIRALKWGVKYQDRDPKHPNGNLATFRKSMGQSTTAGMPGGDYNTIFNDLENINFSAGRLGRLDTNEMSKLIQRFDIDVAERPIFESWLEMALITGAINLPTVKFDKFNKPLFQGRRWAQVDEIKAVNSAALRVANKFSSRNRECAELGIDFEENALELAEEEMLLESLGLESAMTVEHEPVAQPADDVSDTNPTTGGTNKPAPTKKPAKTSNGEHAEELEVSRV